MIQTIVYKIMEMMDRIKVWIKIKTRKIKVINKKAIINKITRIIQKI